MGVSPDFQVCLFNQKTKQKKNIRLTARFILTVLTKYNNLVRLLLRFGLSVAKATEKKRITHDEQTYVFCATLRSFKADESREFCLKSKLQEGHSKFCINHPFTVNHNFHFYRACMAAEASKKM